MFPIVLYNPLEKISNNASFIIINFVISDKVSSVLLYRKLARFLSVDLSPPGINAEQHSTALKEFLSLSVYFTSVVVVCIICTEYTLTFLIVLMLAFGCLHMIHFKASVALSMFNRIFKHMINVG